MKIISLWEPFATLWVLGYKIHETRGWRTSYRGPLAVHAARRWTSQQRALILTDPFYPCLLDHWPTIGRPNTLGCIVGVVDLQDCVRTEQLDWLDRSVFCNHHVAWLDRSFGDFRPGRWAWLAGSPTALDRPIPLRGQQGMWTAPPDVRNQITAQTGLNVSAA